MSSYISPHAPHKKYDQADHSFPMADYGYKQINAFNVYMKREGDYIIKTSISHARDVYARFETQIIHPVHGVVDSNGLRPDYEGGIDKLMDRNEEFINFYARHLIEE